MDKIFLDTNAVLSLLTDRNADQRDTVLGLVRQSLRGDVEIVLHQHVVSETVFTLLNVYGVPEITVVQMMKDLLNHPGAVVENELVWDDVFQLWPGKLSDFGDAIVAVAARRGSYPVFTFDRKFRKKLNALRITTRSLP